MTTAAPERPAALSALELLRREGNPFRNYFARNPDDDVCARFHVDELFARERAQLLAIVDLYRWKCRSFCLMGTLFHLILNTPEPTLSRGMQHLCGAYAQWFNWK